MGHLEHKQESPQRLSCAVLTISNSRSQENDESGKLIIKALKEKGHNVVAYAIVKNDTDAIRSKLNELLANGSLQVIITSGGTGVSHLDVTVETVSPILEKKLDGFGELFRFLSYQEIGTASIMSRALAGVARNKAILCLPGSVAAARLAMDKIILPEMGHIIREATR